MSLRISTLRASDSPATYGALQMCFDLLWFDAGADTLDMELLNLAGDHLWEWEIF